MRPLLLFGVLYVFFVVISKVGGGDKPGEAFYGVQLLGSIILFGFFGEATGGAVRSVVDRENLVRKIQFPRLVIPLSITLLALFNLAMNLVVVLIFALISGVTPMLSWLELPLILIDADPLLDRHRDVAGGDVRQIPRHPADLGSLLADPLLRLARDHPRRKRARKARRTASSTTSCGTSTCSTHWSTIFQQFRHAMVNHATLSAGQAATAAGSICSSRWASSR